ncbi:hypothetical protein P154DRAFT_196354 [Amniculicola lignicola CBS 123094]|uniref:Transcription factor TFIIIC triple barrel domain-containing protein n=1 Tax=Amniculicola lignicola CBS 123094 TaxID=1392246 RepID=A0A6A5WFW6_9PLEO|nr:hypothetical protein P154DRAFT_196354 [Amniculicola lignicola CBS 123094]
MANPEDDEWEYEYDDTATEDFYIALDLSHTVPDHSTGSDDEDEDEKLIPDYIAKDPEFLKSRLRDSQVKVPAGESSMETEEFHNPGQLQVTGLHTQNPLAMFDGKLYSCNWTSTIGTDMFFAKPAPGADSTSKPLRSLQAAELIALGNTKLVGVQSRLRPRDYAPDSGGIRNKQVPSNILHFKEGFELAKATRKKNERRARELQRRRTLAKQREGEEWEDTDGGEDDEDGWGGGSEIEHDSEMVTPADWTISGSRID